MQSLLLLWQSEARSWASRCRTSTTRDFNTVTSRVEHEGVSFLTISLPRFCDDFQKSLANGKVDRCLFQGFSWTGGLPRFLGGFLDLVFDRGTGLLVDVPNIDAIQAIRQLTLMFGKIELPCSPARVDAAIDAYIDCEKEVRKHDSERTEADNLAFTRLSRLLWADVFAQLDRKVYEHDLYPKHGPGATADQLKGNRKWEQLEWPRRLDDVFPVGEYLIPNWRYNLYLDRVLFLEPGAERPVKVITVPKTLKTPRIIAVEPTAMQYMQQSLSRDLVDTIESGDSRFGWCLGFRSQIPNQEMARKGSSSGSLATLDLSEASDRVSNQLVRAMLADHPWLAKGVDACRSRKADVPGHGVIRLAKFASMGSALTFPLEAIVFSTCVFLGIERELSRQLTPRDVQSLKGQVRVYGDDIVVPTHYVRSVVETLESFGFKVNLNKSFWTGKFRESCGKEYYDGHDVSITRVRSLIPSQRTDEVEIISTVSLRNRFYLNGSWRTARYLDKLLESLLGHYPTVTPGSSCLGRWSFVSCRFGRHVQGLCKTEEVRIHPYAHTPLVKGYVIRAKLPASKLEGVAALQKILLSKAARDGSKDPFMELFHMEEASEKDDPYKDYFLALLRGVELNTMEGHLERQGRPRAVGIKLRWTSPTSR